MVNLIMRIKAYMVILDQRKRKRALAKLDKQFEVLINLKGNNHV